MALVQCKDSITTTDTAQKISELPKPELVSPIDSAQNQSTQIELSWKKMKGAKQYQVQMAKSNQFDSPLVDSLNGGTSMSTPELETGTTYFWHVKPYKDNYNGPALKWSDTWQFTTASAANDTTTLAGPTLISPVDGAGNISMEPTFKWNAVEGADYYILDANRINPSEMTFHKKVIDTTFSPADDLSSGTTYDWRVHAVKDSVNGKWSEINRFTTTSSSSGTNTVTLTSPSDGATNQSTSLSLQWEAVSGISNYEVQLATSSSFSSPLVDKTTSNTSYDVSGLSNSQTYYWRVQATGDNDTQNWSSTWSFQTESGTQSVPSVTLTSPSDGATNFSTSPTLQWQSISGISNYQVQLATSSSFSSPVVDQTASSTSYDVSGLSNSQTYYWRVQATGDNDTQNWSNVWSFTTKSSTTTNSNGTDSRAGDEAALEALYQSTNGSNWTNNTGWSASGMSLSNNIYGVTVASINGELRVTKIDLRHNGLTGSIDDPEIGNLKQMTLFAVYGNSLHSQIPPELMSLTKLEYLYLCVADPNGDLATMYPHEEAQTGGGDVHPSKDKVDENNVFYGTVPAPSDPSAMHLKWFILNWTESSAGAEDGISSISPGLFDVTTFVGLQIHETNGIADLPFPDGICNMTNLDNLALGVQKAGRGTGYLTGSVPKCFGQLSNLQFVRLHENEDLTFDFDVVDLSGMTALRNFIIEDTDMKGSFPSALTDGSLPNLIGFNISFPSGQGMTGTLDPGSTNLEIALIGDHNLSGSIPAGFWDNESMINTYLSYNNFTSIGTTDLTGLGSHYWKIRNLRWDHNNIHGKWPNLAWGTSRLNNFSRFEVDNNNYVFSDMLWIPSEYNPSRKTIFQLYHDHGLSSFRYSPQKPFGQSRTITASIGSSITIDDFDGVVTHPDNVYQWQKDGAKIAGVTSRSFTISNFQVSDEGVYTLVVTNPGVPGLTLTSEPIKLVSKRIK